MKKLMILCLVASNRLRLRGDPDSIRIAQLLIEPNFVLYIKKFAETKDGEPILASIPKALEAIASMLRKREDLIGEQDVQVIKGMLTELVNQGPSAPAG
jgi:hypothetical protein